MVSPVLGFYRAGFRRLLGAPGILASSGPAVAHAVWAQSSSPSGQEYSSCRRANSRNS